MGVVPVQSALDAQVEQVPVVTSQCGDDPVHAVLFVAEHCPHCPDGWQAGSSTGQFASLVQVVAGSQAPALVPVVTQSPPAVPVVHWALLVQPSQEVVVGLQIGLVPEQSALDVHPVQVRVVRLQVDGGVQAVALSAEH